MIEIDQQALTQPSMAFNEHIKVICSLVNMYIYSEFKTRYGFCACARVCIVQAYEQHIEKLDQADERATTTATDTAFFEIYYEIF